VGYVKLCPGLSEVPFCHRVKSSVSFPRLQSDTKLG
jgi:hypothetical protein